MRQALHIGPELLPAHSEGVPVGIDLACHNGDSDIAIAKARRGEYSIGLYDRRIRAWEACVID